MPRDLFGRSPLFVRYWRVPLSKTRLLTNCPRREHIIPTMNTPRFPDPPNFDVVLEKLKPLLDTISEAVQEGTLHVREYCKWQAESIDFALAPNLVRHKAKQILISSGQDAEDEDEDKMGFDTEPIPNNGIFIKVAGFHVRVLKSPDDGSIPSPGLSIARQNFYKHSQALLDFEEFRNG